LGIIVAIVFLPDGSWLAAGVLHYPGGVSIQQIRARLLRLGAGAAIGATAVELLLLAGQHYGAIEHPALLPLVGFRQCLPFAATDRVLIAGVFQYYLHLAAGGQGLAANPIADGLVPFLAGLGFI